MHKPIILIKVGGNELDEPGFIEVLVDTIKSLQTNNNCIIVHGGGKAISELMSRLGVKPEYKNGQRITNAAALEAAEMALSAKINKHLVMKLGQSGLDAIGLSGIDRQLLTVEAWGENLGLVGRITNVRTEVLFDLIEKKTLPVISPISAGPGGKYNVNADHAAGKIAGALRANKTIFISNVLGVLVDGEPASELSDNEIFDLIEDGAINGGMIPKVNAALDALRYGAQAAVIANLAGLANNCGTIIYQHKPAIQQKPSDAQPVIGGLL